MASTTPRIFVSSTFEDLKEYRKAVCDAILRMGAVPTLLETFSASAQPVHEIIQEQLAMSDAAILLVGFRYGAVDPQRGKSWVEAEYEAIRRQKKPCIVFMAAPEAPWPPMYVDADQTQIQKFRERLSADLAVRFFQTPDELRVVATEALSHWFAALERKPQPQVDQDQEPRKVRIVRLLLSSPGDVPEERDRVVKAVFRFNQFAVEERGLFVKLVRWEDMAPQIGPNPQNVINKQIGDYHFFMGIMWNRFGTPTEIAASGTKEEFDTAVNAWEKHNRPWVTFYFCDRPANFTNAQQLQQKMLVVDFRTELYAKGIVRSFTSPDEFEEIVYRDMYKITVLPEFLEMIKGKVKGG
jgi:Domain of unknown function (DUF4062)